MKVVAFLIDNIGFIAALGLFGIIFCIGALCARADEKDAEKHLEFLSERAGYGVKTFKEWCEHNKINHSKYWNDPTVKRAYENYILNIENKVRSGLC